MAKAGALIKARDRQEEGEDGLVRLCRLMRIMSERDTEATVAQVLRAMLEARERPVGGSELSRGCGLNRITVIHHLRRLESAGIVQRQESKYVLRASSLEGIIEWKEQEMLAAFEEIDELARSIDREFEFDMGEIHERKKRIGRR